MTLTPRQLDVLYMIRDYRHEHGYAPTLQEIADALGMTKVTAWEHVLALHRRGFIERTAAARSIEILIDLPRKKVNLRWAVISTIAKQGITLKGKA